VQATGQTATVAQAPTVVAVPVSTDVAASAPVSAQDGRAVAAAPVGAHVEAGVTSAAVSRAAILEVVTSGSVTPGFVASAGAGVATGAPANVHAAASVPTSATVTTAATTTTATTGGAPAAFATAATAATGATQLESSRPDLKAIPVPVAAPVVAPETKAQAAKGAGRTAGRQVSGSVPVILFDSVSKIYASQPNKPALSNVSLKIYAGEFIFLVGHSGSGKSTFIRLINREILASKGRLTVAGEDVIRMRNWRVPYLRRNIGCVFQDFKLLPNKTAFDNVAFALEVIGKSKHIIRTQVPEVLRLVGLEDKLDKYPDQLSGGEQQRVSIARAIVNRPPLLICDEPTGNLDPQTSLGIMRLLDRINRTGTTILVATHDREMVDSLRKRVVALENGYLVRDQDKGVYGLDA
jgi:cell division transport system ATP-binding protein